MMILLLLVSLSAVELEAPGLPCPDASALRGEVKALLERDPFPEDPQRRFTVSIRPRQGGLEARVELRRGDRLVGERELFTHAPDCEALVAAVALDMAIALDPLAAVELEAKAAARRASVEPASRPASPPATQPASEPTSEPATQPPQPPAPRPARLKLLLEPRLGLGDGPLGAMGLRIGGGVKRGALEGALALRGDLPREAITHGGSVYSRLVTLEAEACRGFGEPFLCGLAAVGGQRVGGAGYSESRDSWHLYAAIGARAGWRLPLVEGLNLEPTLAVTAPLRPTILRVAGDVVWESPPVNLDIGLRLTWMPAW